MGAPSPQGRDSGAETSLGIGTGPKTSTVLEELLEAPCGQFREKNLQGDPVS